MTIDSDILTSQVVQSLCQMYATECTSRSLFSRKAPSIPGMLNAVGACGGFAAQVAVWRELILPSHRNPGDFLLYASTKSNETFYLGEAINQFLFSSSPDRLSFLSFAGVSLSSAAELPDIPELARHVAGTLGSDRFGRPRLPSSIDLPELPQAALSRTWGKAAQILQPHRPAEWPAVLGATAHAIISDTRNTLAPPVAVRILLESAVPISKLNPVLVEQSGVRIEPVAQWSMRAAQAEHQQEIIAEARQAMPATPARIAAPPLVIAQPAIAFVNWCGARCETMVAWDCAQIGELFGDKVVTSTGAIPRCDVLFLYCDFTASGIAGQSSVRDLIRESGARIAVIATELPPDLMSKNEFPKSLDRGKSQPVNLVFVMRRNGLAFRRFFRALFQHMLDGESMTLAWMKLAPQVPHLQPPDMPVIMCLTEAPSVTFRK